MPKAPTPRAKASRSKLTPYQKAEATLVQFALTLPEVDYVPSWPPTRCLRVRKRTFCQFGDKGEGADALTITLKLPVSFDMIQDLPFVSPSEGWHKQRQWAHAHFGEGEDPLAEFETLKTWLLQSYRAMAPKSLGKLV